VSSIAASIDADADAMNRMLFLSTALLTALAALPAPVPAEAASDGALLLRCRSPDGTIGYTDRSCAVFGAKSVPIDAQLVTRIVRDQARQARLQAMAAGAQPDFDMGSATHIDDAYAAAPATPGRRSPASGCARTPAQLANDLQASVALGDVNRIAESYHFAGMSTAAGERVLDRLQRYAGRSVVDSNYYAASMGPALDDTGAGDAPGVVQLVLGGQEGGAAAVDFDVERYAGCYFVSFA
jgi:hypothetical protein